MIIFYDVPFPCTHTSQRGEAGVEIETVTGDTETLAMTGDIEIQIETGIDGSVTMTGSGAAVQKKPRGYHHHCQSTCVR